MKRHFLIGLVVLTLAACATSPLGRRQLHLFPEDQMTQMGVAAYRDIKKQMPETDRPAVSRYVHCVADAVTSVVDKGPRNWEVTVFDKEEANAFALPGGKIGVNSGLLDVARNQDQLATVIGHEIAHVTADHANERVSTSFATQTGLDLIGVLASGKSGEKDQLLGLLGLGTQLGIILPFSRTQETEADLLGLDIMAQAGFDPRASIDLWQNMEKTSGGAPPEFLSTHPSHGSRIDDLRKRIPKAMKLYEKARAEGRRPDCRPPGR